MEAAATHQAVLSAATTGRGITAMMQAVMTAAFRPPATKYIRSSQDILSASTTGRGVPGTSQVVGLVAYRTGSVEDLNNRAWTYTLDGHIFYVLTLGEQGTYVYDMTTGQWTQWQTQGLSGWNMEIGTTWQGKIIAADQQNPIIWELTPKSFIDDDFKAQIRVATGALPVRQRTFTAVYAVTLTASVGKVTVPDTVPATIGEVTLSYSDDQGVSFVSAETIPIVIGNSKQQIQWLSLGTMQAPGRVFRITDTGAITRIGGADAELSEEGE